MPKFLIPISQRPFSNALLFGGAALVVLNSGLLGCSDSASSEGAATGGKGGTSKLEPPAEGGSSGVDGSGGSYNGSPESLPVHATCPGEVSDAYLAVPALLPGSIEAENFDPGGYSDNSEGNQDGAYRTDEDVDIKTLDVGHAISWWNDGEWLEYTVIAPQAGDYEISFEGGSVNAGQSVEISSCGSPIASIVVPQIADWGETRIATARGHLEAGVQVIRFTVGSGYVDFDRVSFSLISDPQTGSGGNMGSGGGSGGDSTCPLPSSFQWTSTGPLAQPADPNWDALKDFSVTKYNGKYIVYGTVAVNNGWQGFFSTFSSFDEFDTAAQNYHGGHVAPTIFYFEPKDTWVLAYQWGFQYKTSKTPDVWASWSSGQSLLNTNPDPTGGAGTGPIDQTIICDDSDCYLFFNDDAGGVYRASMPIADFPGQFSGAKKIMQQSTSVIFEGIQVYSIKGSDKYLMMIENNGVRAFRAWTNNDLSSDNWTPLVGADTTQSPFAGQANTTWPSGQWSTDISHGDIVRENPSEKMEIDPCHMQLLYQGKGDSQGVGYGQLPYRPGLLTLVK